MEEQNKLLSIINVPTQAITSVSIQAVLIAAKGSQHEQYNTDFWNVVTEIMWHHLQEGLAKFDDQLLCGTCFYTVLSLSNKEEAYLTDILEVVRDEIVLKEKNLKGNKRTLLALSVMYGMFQSSFITDCETQTIYNLTNLLEAVFELLHLMANEYSKYTFIVFKTVNSYKKVCGTRFQETLFSKSNQIKLLNLVNHNWENPITGVRDLNKGIFQTLISMLNGEMYDDVIKETNKFYWNKAKYLMLAEIIRHSGKDLNYMATKLDWIDGLVSSLYKPGLVSSGADMYFAFLKNIQSYKEWCQIFKKPILNLLRGASQKGIENFCNYWCLTTFKTYPDLAEMLLNELQFTMYSSLCVLKQANKLNILKKDWDFVNNRNIENTVLCGLVHCNNQIRITAFDILCLSHNKAMPTKTEYDLVLEFLKNNVNSDCTVLRIGMLKSFSNFLTQVHISYLHYLKNIEDKEILKCFCYNFQTFIEFCITIDGNYQRKITSIKLIDTFIKGLKEVPRKRQKQTRKSEQCIIQMLKDEEHWLLSEDKMIKSLVKLMKDPAEDIRENVGQLLLEHYSVQVSEINLINALIDDALKCMSSKFFYEISCGQSMFRLIINVLIQEQCLDAKFETSDDVFSFALNELITEYHLKRGIMESIEKGKQLHSFMSILYVVLEICLHKKKSIIILNENINTLLVTLEGISNQFTWEQDSATNSDFSKMSDMVEDIIYKSRHNQRPQADQTKISGLHQIVLNCLWLNVKMSCELSSLLVKYQFDNKGTGISRKTLDIICHVLETCRHKGAIEAAGSALGQCIHHLTSLDDETEISKLPFTFLKSKLNDLISEASNMVSVTRRGAGLSILVHRIVSSDAKKGKPLFHYFMKTILEACNKAEDIPSKLNGAQNIDNKKDLPKAIYIHFLTKIVTDSSLASDIMFYSAELAELAFGNLTSPYWQIRNAALQLYGALIQKLIGQKKASGTDDETIATVACDELRTHSPKLWIHIQQQLRHNNVDDYVQYHSNLVPILNMLANIARRYNFSLENFEQKKEDLEILHNLMSLLQSPIYTVRRLTAKSIFNIYNFDEIYDYLVNKQNISENYLHGSLMLIAFYSKLHGFKDTSKFDELKRKYQVILKDEHHSYLCKEIFEEVFFDEASKTINDVEVTLAELRANHQLPGVFLWANKQIQNFVKVSDCSILPELVNIIVHQNEFESYLSILMDRIEKKSMPESLLLNIVDVLLWSNNKFESTMIWKILYKLILKIDHAQLQALNISEIFVYIEEERVSYKLRYIIPFAARLLAVGVDYRRLLVISKIIEGLIDPQTADIEMRLIAAIANNELGSEITYLPEVVKVTVIKSAIILLQDEDEDVRIRAAEFYKRTSKVRKVLQPYICFCKILSHNFLTTIISDSAISILARELLEYLSKVSSKDVDEYNPFANDSSNIYLEFYVFKQLIESL